MGKLILARHHESEWNKLGRWTGKRDQPLTPYGFQKAKDMGLMVKDIHIDQAFASMLVRTIETLSCILNVCERYDVPTEHASELNERDYGDLTGKNKWEVKEAVGEEEFTKLRRSWDYPPPNGESLKDVYNRVLPYFKSKILPAVNSDKNVLVVAHGNSLRAITKYIENIPDDKISEVEIPFGAIIIYDLDKEGRQVKKEVRHTESEVNA
jgi:2,3-bisphosphoglycerate-dependent phosphoglycerate mutase